METQTLARTSRVVLLCVGNQPTVPGVCCWRFSVREAFAAAGATVDEVTWRPHRLDGSTGRFGLPTPSWLPAVGRKAIAVADHRAWQTSARLHRATTGRRTPTQLADLAKARLVIAETPQLARAAVARGLPWRLVWALLLPSAQRLGAAEARHATDAAESVAGFLTDSQSSRDCIEQAIPSQRPQIVLFPPLAIDRICPACGHPTAGVDPDSIAGPQSAAAQLTMWRNLLEQIRQGNPPTQPYTFPASRIGGLALSASSGRTAWDGRPAVKSADELSIAPSPGSDWSASAQEQAARMLLDMAAGSGAGRPRRTLLSGFDLKFAYELADRLDSRPDLDITVDEWKYISFGGWKTRRLARQADSIFAEWARPNAALFSRHKRAHQQLVVRLHRYELESQFPKQILIENVDAVVYIAPWCGRRIRDDIGWPVEKLVYIPNYLDVDWLDRPKLPDARFTLGMVGVEWANKRFDLALDLLAELRRQDPRFRLLVRSTMPWNSKYAWEREEERRYTDLCLARIEHDPLLRNAVTFDTPGKDMARWYRQVGYVLSTSDIEGAHTAAAEGMASGAVPVIRPWHGAADIYADEWISSSTEEAAKSILENADVDTWAERGARARAEIRRTYDPVAVVQAWADLLHGDVERARSYFAEYSSL